MPSLPRRFQLVEHLHQLRGVQAELAPLPTALAHLPGARGGQLDAHPDGRLHAHLVGHLQEDVHLAELLDAR